MAASNTKFYIGDLVIKNSQKIEAGRVLETDEFLNSDDEDEIEIDGQQSMKKDHILVEWQDRTGFVEKIAQSTLDLNPNEEILPEKNAKLYDRQLYKSEVVKRVGSEMDQLGYCSSRSITADVQVVGTQHVLTNIESTDLERQKEGFWVRSLGYCIDMYFKGWKIPFISFMLRIYLHLLPRRQPQIGAHLFLKMKDSYRGVPLHEWKTLMAAKLSISSRTLEIPWKTSWTLKKVYTYCFGYLWIIYGFFAIYMHFQLFCYNSNVWSEGLNGISFEFLGRYFHFYCWFQFLETIVLSKILKKLYFETVLCYFSFRGLIVLLLPNFHNKLDDYFNENTKYISASLGEKYFNFLGYVFWCYCFIKSVLMLRSVVRRGLRRSLKDFAVFYFWREKALVPEEKLAVEILVTQTRADVIWQDGSFEQDVLSTKLLPAWDMATENDFFPGNHVLRNEGSFADSRSYDYGVVKNMNHSLQTAIIKWMKTDDTDGNPHPEVVTEQEVSVYDIICHPTSGRDVIGVNNLELSAEDSPNEDDPIATNDQSPPEDSPLVEDRVAIQKEEEGANSELSLEANEEQPIDAAEMSKDITERNSTANENRLEDIREHDNMPKTDPPSQGILSMFESVPDNHKYKLSVFQPDKLGPFASIVRKEMNILKSSLPAGIMVKCFEDRIDLFSVLIKGPKMTPYEDGLFFFDIQLPADYPNSPPLCHYVSYSKGPLNPNLYEGGKVCVSLLGTVSGQGTQMWNKETSSLLQVVVSIQGLILVSEPYYNGPGYEREKRTPLGNEKSRLYNEKVVLQLVGAMIKLKMNPPELFQKEISDHFQTSKMVERLERWVEISETWNTTRPKSPASPSTSGKLHEDGIGSQYEVSLPDFPLIPASKGFCLTLKKSIETLKIITANEENQIE